MTQTTTALAALAALAVLAVLAVLLSLGGGAAQHPDLSGHWALNPGESDNPKDMMQGRDNGGGQPGGGVEGDGDVDIMARGRGTTSW